jgi:3-oxosteroid 1-dehydrogenase
MEPPRGGVIIVGAGLSGLATALGVALRGRPVTVFESADQVGGAAAYSGGQVWAGANHVEEREGVFDNLAETERYVRGIAARPDLLDDAALARWIENAPSAMAYWEDVGAVRWTIIDGLADYHSEVAGAHGSGRYLTGEPFPAAALGDWRGRLRVSPYFRMGTTYADLFEKGRRLTVIDGPDDVGQVSAAGTPRSARDSGDADMLTFGTGLVAGFLARLSEHADVEILLSCPVTELLRDASGRVVGVRARGADGIVERRGPVVLATSTYDWDPELAREFLSLEPEDFGSMAPDSLRGDGIRLARSVGAAVVMLPATTVPMVPGWRATDGSFANGPEYAMPHAVIVDERGQRFCNDSYWPDLIKKALDPADPHIPFFLIWDEQHHRKYGLGATPPGGEYPAGLVSSAATLRELGEHLGIDGAALDASTTRFNAAAMRGEDPEFGRGTIEFINRFSGDPSHAPNPVLGTVAQAPFFGMRLRLLGTGIGMSGVHADAGGHVLDDAGAVIPGLYAVGSSAAMTTTGGGYNSGFALGRGLTMAYIVAKALMSDPGLSGAGEA